MRWDVASKWHAGRGRDRLFRHPPPSRRVHEHDTGDGAHAGLAVEQHRGRSRARRGVLLYVDSGGPSRTLIRTMADDTDVSREGFSRLAASLRSGGFLSSLPD